MLGARVEAVHGRDVERARQVLDNGVEQRLDAFVLEGGPEQHRRHLGVERRCAQRAPDHLGRHRILVLEVGLEELLVLLRDRVDQLVVVLARLFAQLLRNLVLVDVHAERVVVREGTHLDQVDDPAEALLASDRQLNGHRLGAQAVDHRLDGLEEVGAGAVHLVDEGDAWNVVAVGLPPDRLGLRLDARDGVEDGDGAVEHAQAALHLDRKVHVAGRIDNVDAKVAPGRCRRSRRDRDAALLLLRHPVHRRGALVHLAHLVGATRVIEDPLGRRGLARVDVGHDPDVPGALEREGCLGCGHGRQITTCNARRPYWPAPSGTCRPCA